MPLHRSLARALMISCLLAATACQNKTSVYRGAGLQVAALPVSDRVAVYRAALAGAFTLEDSSLSLVVDPVQLPRVAGLAGGDTLPPDVLAALRRTGLVKGTCTIPVTSARIPLICRAERAGYAVRFSDPFTMGASADSIQVHLVVQQYAIPNGAMSERLRFERAYVVARRPSGWRAVREARLSQP